ncbi:flagellar export chaperone FliS [Candidatus Methylobacter oryzae]|uniref:Flagellar secretion chaperone FliS n=1 Tax=Candidatus Methylobacter oryzae TaxID=2497749 RepID=A0ABY3C8P2_9GAMM|nr:flagellar export chaperone FliS [Candidatus Methylobacter oryzae]TRW93003.1 flagellar export chaperone FliS [Candidatus Methylobacter oryzae]
MYPSAYKRGVNQYANIHNESGLAEASPHHLIQMLMEGFLARVNTAKGAMARSDMEMKSLYISRAMAIVGGLNEAVDLDKGGEIAVNLRQLYDYMNNRLLQASRENNVEILDEVASLMREIKEGWDAIKN